MAIVFLAGPLSGLIVQPLVGVLSDGCKSRLGRRKPFIIGGCAVTSLSVLLLGWTKEIAGIFTKVDSDAVSFSLPTSTALDIDLAIFLSTLV